MVRSVAAGLQLCQFDKDAVVVVVVSLVSLGSHSRA